MSASGAARARARRFAWCAPVFLGILAGCGGTGELQPPRPRWGEDVCASCGMIVSEERFAAAAAFETASGRFETTVYDDVVCLLGDLAKRGPATARARWVHDHDGSNWLPAERAIFVRSGEVQSPMGSGVAGFADRARAQEFQTRHGGEVVDWAELQARGAGGLVSPPPSAGRE